MPIMVPVLLLSLSFLPSPPVSLYPSVPFPKPSQTWAHNAPPPLLCSLFLCVLRWWLQRRRRLPWRPTRCTAGTQLIEWLLPWVAVCDRGQTLCHTHAEKFRYHWRLNYWVVCPRVSGKGGSKGKCIWSDRVSGLAGRAVKSPSHWISCVLGDGRSFISPLCSRWHSPADTLCPTLARTADRGEEWENNQQRKEWEKGLSCHDDSPPPPGCPFRIWLVLRWFSCGRLICPLFKVLNRRKERPAALCNDEVPCLRVHPFNQASFLGHYQVFCEATG